MPHSHQHLPQHHKTVILCERPVSARTTQQVGHLHPSQSATLITRPVSSQPLTINQEMNLPQSVPLKQIVNSRIPSQISYQKQNPSIASTPRRPQNQNM